MTDQSDTFQSEWQGSKENLQSCRHKSNFLKEELLTDFRLDTEQPGPRYPEKITEWTLTVIDFVPQLTVKQGSLIDDSVLEIILKWT